MTGPMFCLYIGTSVVASKNNKPELQRSPVRRAMAKFAIGCVVLSILWWFIGGTLACLFEGNCNRKFDVGIRDREFDKLGGYFAASAVLLCLLPAVLAICLFLQVRKEEAQAQAQISQVPV
jgi:hypothetical protein